MTNKSTEKYLRAIRRRLNMSKDAKDRVMADFISSIQCRREEGQTEEEIIAELGTPQKAADELNEQMAEYTYRKSPWRWLCFTLATVCALVLLRGGVGALMTAVLSSINRTSVGIIGGADGPTAIFVTTSPDALQYAYGMSALLLIMGVIGFIALGKLKQK